MFCWYCNGYFSSKWNVKYGINIAIYYMEYYMRLSCKLVIDFSVNAEKSFTRDLLNAILMLGMIPKSLYKIILQKAVRILLTFE